MLSVLNYNNHITPGKPLLRAIPALQGRRQTYVIHFELLVSWGIISGEVEIIPCAEWNEGIRGRAAKDFSNGWPQTSLYLQPWGETSLFGYAKHADITCNHVTRRNTTHDSLTINKWQKCGLFHQFVFWAISWRNYIKPVLWKGTSREKPSPNLVFLLTASPAVPIVAKVVITDDHCQLRQCEERKLTLL
jgi:hypothetical protein